MEAVWKNNMAEVPEKMIAADGRKAKNIGRNRRYDEIGKSV
jgi:hypothetical protein